MTKKIIFEDSFLVSGIMCYQGCGVKIQNFLNNLDELKQQGLLPSDAQLLIDAEPQALGHHRLLIMVESHDQTFNQYGEFNSRLSTKFKAMLNRIKHVELIDVHADHKNNKLNKSNWINVALNLVSTLVIIVLFAVFPPSLFLTIGLTALSFLTTAFTARSYFANFFSNLINKNTSYLGSSVTLGMETFITLGWLLSFTHTLYHLIAMPLVSSFSMMFMSFIMPILLITIINGMDEIKRVVLNKSKKMYLKGMKALFPSMVKDYECYSFAAEEQEKLSAFITELNTSTSSSPNLVRDYERYPLRQQEQIQLARLLASFNKNTIAAVSDCSLEQCLEGIKTNKSSKNRLKKGMLIKVRRNECFPVDSFLVYGNSLIDTSILTGEPQQPKQPPDFVPAGAINRGLEVVACVIQNSYNSTVNKLLFRSNRVSKENAVSEPSQRFIYFYGALILIGFFASLLIPFALGNLTIPLFLQNLTGIVFNICPCTIATAHLLPKLLSIYRRHNKGILMRNERLTARSEPIDTVVFDKTGTLTTGNSQVDSYEGISPALWQRIYLLEKQYGSEHPLAKAITSYYEKTHGVPQSIIKPVEKVLLDPKNRGLSALVQGKQIHIGNSGYLQELGIGRWPTLLTFPIKEKLEQGYTPVYVAEDGVYRGVILIKHEIREGVLASLTRLKKEKKRLIMLTGDSQLSATGFNQQNNGIFDAKNIHAKQTPMEKEIFLKKLMDTKDINPKTVWFIGDGLNDAPCVKMVTEKGGVSCAMTADDKASFFTDISLNGKLDYLFEHTKLNRFLKKNIIQNQWILAYGSITFLAFIISFSIIGIAVSPLIPMVIMVSTTLFTLFNSYRVKLAVDNALDKAVPWLKKFLSSDLSIGLLLAASLLLVSSLLISTVATGGVTLPILAFTAGTSAMISSVCVLLAGALFGVFAVLSIGYLFAGKESNARENLREIKGARLSPGSPKKDSVQSFSSMSMKTLDFGYYRRNRKKEQPDANVPGTLPGARVGLLQ